ncbi:hypothetical protein N0V90_005913 [Kalmusia sp. IMI 367209]|nr:hypothetical protein N0V90_005913 [Kalmusia sp. IMI 367209]
MLRRLPRVCHAYATRSFPQDRTGACVVVQAHVDILRKDYSQKNGKESKKAKHTASARAKNSDTPNLDEAAQRAIKAAREQSKHYAPLNAWNKDLVLRDWEKLGPPPLSEYRLTFGKHRGKKVDEVPHTYLVKYLIPQSHAGLMGTNCPIVVDAVKDYMKRHPEVHSQAGPMKTRAIKKEEINHEHREIA